MSPRDYLPAEPNTAAERQNSIGAVRLEQERKEFMSIDTSRHVEEHAADTSAPKFVVISSAEAPPVPEAAEAMTVRVTLPPGSPGLPPHRHSGPAFGYVVEGEMIFELEGEPERVAHAGGTFWEPGGDVIHYQDGNWPWSPPGP
jgi:quercetin dioxygenase-like cupin family protein